MRNLGTTEPRTSDAAKYRSHLDTLKRPKMPNIAQLQAFIMNNMPRCRLQIDALSERGAILSYTVDPSDYGHKYPEPVAHATGSYRLLGTQ